MPILCQTLSCVAFEPFVALHFWSKDTLGNPLYKRVRNTAVRETLLFKKPTRKSGDGLTHINGWLPKAYVEFQEFPREQATCLTT